MKAVYLILEKKGRGGEGVQIFAFLTICNHLENIRIFGAYIFSSPFPPKNAGGIKSPWNIGKRFFVKIQKIIIVFIYFFDSPQNGDSLKFSPKLE